MDTFTSNSIYFTHAYSASPTMTYGLAAIHSGRYASELVRNDSNWPSFSVDNQFLASRLKRRGYQTAAFLSHWYFDEGSGLETDFEVWKPRVAEKGRTRDVASAKKVFSRSVSYLERASEEKPYFLWAHTIDPRKNYLEHLDIPRFGRDVVAQYDHEVRYVDEMLSPMESTPRRSIDVRWSSSLPIWARTLKNGSRKMDSSHYPNHSSGYLFIRIPGTRAQPQKERISLVRLPPTILELARKTEDPSPLKMPVISLRPLAKAMKPQNPFF